MFGKAKKQENKYIIAVKDLTETQKALQAETISLPFEKSLYRDLLASSVNKATTQKDLHKFIKSANKNKGEVKHFWEGLIDEGYTIMDVLYDSKAPSIERLLDTPKFRLLCSI